MSKTFELYVCDTETTGLDATVNDIVELSLYRLSDNEQKTWCLKPLNKDNIDANALRVNGHKIEDLLHQTMTGAQKYLKPTDVIVDIENWLMMDGVSSEDRILVGQSISFDKGFMEQLWNKCQSSTTFPFNKRYTMDTMQLQFAMDYAKNEVVDSYSLFALTKKYGIKNEKAHTASADCLATVKVFQEQIAFIKESLNK